MGYRAGFVLVNLLEETRAATSSELVRAGIDDALAFVASRKPTLEYR